MASFWTQQPQQGRPVPGQRVQPMQPVQGYLVPQQQYQGGESSDDGSYSNGPYKDCMIHDPQVPAYIRSGFIRKVYSILSIQLAFTACVVFYMNTQFDQYWMTKHIGVYYLCAFGSLGLMMGIMCCCQNALRSYPMNYALLAVFTLAMAVVTGAISTRYHTYSIVIAVAATSITFGCLTAYACFTKTDFSGIGPYLYAGLSSMIGFSFVLFIFSMFMPLPSWTRIAFSCAGVILFSFYIIYDTQLVMGGKSHQFGIDDYVLAALNLYLDVINLFMYILSLLGDRR